MKAKGGRVKCLETLASLSCVVVILFSSICQSKSNCLLVSDLTSYQYILKTSTLSLRVVMTSKFKNLVNFQDVCEHFCVISMQNG